MNRLRCFFLALAIGAPALALAQWQWIDANGRKVFSDQPPPASIPAKNILKQPAAGGKGMKAVEAEPAAPAPVAAAAASAKAPPAPKLSGKDKELEAKKKQAEAEAAAKKEAEDQAAAKVHAENCKRAKQAKGTLDSGMRVATVNDKGEREVMDDAQRAAETKRLEAVIARECAAAAQ
jgi:hypothetical protein